MNDVMGGGMEEPADVSMAGGHAEVPLQGGAALRGGAWSTQTWLWILIGVLIAAVVGVGIWLTVYLVDKNKTESNALPFSMDMTCQPPTTGGGTWEWSQPLPRVPASAHDQYGVVLQLACTFQFETGVSQLWLELDLADGSTAMLTAKPITDQSPPGSESHRQAFVNELQVQAWAPAHPSDPKPQLCDSAYKLQANGTLLFPVLRIAPGTLPALPVAVRVRLSQPHGHAQYAVVLAVQGEMTPGEVFLQQASP